MQKIKLIITASIFLCALVCAVIPHTEIMPCKTAVPLHNTLYSANTIPAQSEIFICPDNLLHLHNRASCKRHNPVIPQLRNFTWLIPNIFSITSEYPAAVQSFEHFACQILLKSSRPERAGPQTV